MCGACSKSSEADIEISYEDQPNNDYKSLFYHVQGIKQLPQVIVGKFCLVSQANLGKSNTQVALS